MDPVTPGQGMRLSPEEICHNTSFFITNTIVNVCSFNPTAAIGDLLWKGDQPKLLV